MRLGNYRGVADCEVELPTQGITVIEGPNEIGKTSIPEGLDLLLTKMDSSGHRQVKSAQPVGRDVGPEVEIEMSTGNCRFTYRKRWLRRSETVLSVLSPRHEQLTGRAAHERVEEILGETLDRDLWRALRIEQGAELSLPGFDVPSLVSALDQAASGNDAADEDDDLWIRIREEYERYWTATGRPRRERSADDDRDHLRNRIEVKQLSDRHERVVEAEQNLREADTLLESVKVDDDLLEQIEDAHLAVVTTEAAVASVDTTALRDLTIDINGEEVVLGAGEIQHTVVDEDVVLVVSDTAEIRVRAGTGSESLAAQRHRAQQEFHRLCAAAGVTDQAEARHAAEQRKTAERQRHEALETITRDLSDLTVDVLRGKVERLTKRINRYAIERPEDPPLPPDFETAKQVAAARARAVEEQRAVFDTCDRAATSASGALHEEQRKESHLAGRIKGALNAKQQAAASVASARSQRTDDTVASELAQAEANAREALESLADAEAELSAADPESLKVRLQNAQHAVQRASDDLQANRQHQHELRIRLSLRGEEGLHTRREEADGETRHLEREHQRTEARAEAALLLHKTFSYRRQEARQRYSAPFKERIEQLGRIVFNPSFSVDIDQNLRIARRTLDGDTLRIDQLSAGALEQLAVLCRLACASIVSPDGGAPVIIDDALGWSDPDRLERMGAAIAAASGDCQVIILTCTPGRYAHIGNATTIRLPIDA